MIIKAGRFGMRASLNPFQLEFRSSVEEPDRWLVEYAGGHPTASGQTMTERTAVQLTAVFCAVNLISDSIALARPNLWEKTANGRREATDHPVYKLLRGDPNDEMTGFTMWHTFMAHLLLWGNGYLEIERDKGGRPVALYTLRPDRTFPRRLNGLAGAGLGPLVYAVRSSAGQEVTLQPHQVFHVMGYSYDGLRGLSPVALMRETLGAAAAANDYGARFFGNDARPGGVLSHPNRLKKEAAQRLKQSWDEAHRGGSQSFRTAVLEEGVKWQPMGMPNEDAQFLETRIFDISEVARMYHTPPHMLMEMSHSTFSNIEHQAIEYIKHACVPPACRIEDEASRKLLMPAERDRYYVEHDFDEQLRGDLKSRYEAYQIAWQMGWRNADDIGVEENWNPQPNGQGKTYWVPVTQQPVERAINPPDPSPGTVIHNYGGAAAGNAPSGAAPAPGGKAKSGKAPAAAARNFPEQLRILAKAFAPALEHVGDRIARKEAAALSRSGFNGQEFLREHEPYFAEAFTPVFERFIEGIGELLGPEMNMPAPKQDEAVRGYVESFAHRHCEQIGIWSRTDLKAVSAGEAFRAANFFLLKFYTHAQVEFVRVDGAVDCCARCLNRVAAFAPWSDALHPPFHAGCECVVIPAT